MKVVLHAGAHVTDEDRLVKCLLENHDLLEREGTLAPPPALYRKEIRDILNVAHSDGYAPHLRDRALAAVQADAQTERLVLSNPGFFGTPKMAASAGVLYSAAEMRLAILSEIFGEDRIELFLATCNLATFLPAIFQQTPLAGFDDLLRGVPPQDVRWSEMIQRVRTAFPNMPITVWCNEDTPLIWAEVVRELAGLDPQSAITGEFALLSEIMSESGMKRFNAYLESHPGMTEIQKRRVIAAFLDKFAQEDAIEEELDLPGWTDALADELTTLYDEDCDAIRHIPGVHVITP